MRSMSSDRFQELLLNATGETLYMVLLAALFTVAIGLPVGVLLFLTRPQGILPNRAISLLLNALVNTGHARQHRRDCPDYAGRLSLLCPHCRERAG